MKRWWSVVVLVAIAVLTQPVVNHARSGEKPRKLDRVLRKAADAGDMSPQRIIVRARAGRTFEVADRRKKHGDRIESVHQRLNAFTATVHGEDLAALERDPDVEAVSIDAILFADRTTQEVVESETQSGSLLVSTLGLAASEYDGDKVGIAVIDSGLEKSEDLSGGRADQFFDFTTDGRAARPYDDYGHGTHVATLIAGKGKASEREVEVFEDGKIHRTKLAFYRGVAPKARVISLKVLDANGAGYTSAVLRALEFVVANRDKLKIDIINLSLGHPIYESPDTDPLVRAVEDAVRAGLVVVTSAGNYGWNQLTGAVGHAGITSPGNAPSAITVGALDMHDTVDRSDDTVAPYSSRGPAWYSGLAKPDLVAPGHRLVAVGAFQGSLYEQHANRRVWGRSDDKKARYLRLSGTSMAAAVTSGVVALMLEANHRRYEAPLTPNAVKAILEYTALPLAGESPLAQGSGGLNGAGAVLLAEAIDPGRPVGAWWLTGGVSPWTVIAGRSNPWAQSIMWGNRIAAGNVVFANRFAWNDTVIWGTNDQDTVIWGTTDNDTVIWGTTDVVWDDPSVWSQTVVWGTGLVGTTDGSGVLGPTTVIWGTIDSSQ
jgi:serine protease AprX